MAREFFCAYHSYLEAMKEFNDAERGRLFTACLTYSMTGEAPELRGNERFVFPSMKSQIDRDEKRNAEISKKQSRNASMRWHPNACDGMPEHAKDAIEKDKAKEMDISSTGATGAREDLAACCQHYEQNIGALSPYIAESILDRLDNGAQPDLVCAAIDEACASNARSWKYIDAILSRCENAKIHSAAAMHAERAPKQRVAEGVAQGTAQATTNNPFLEMLKNDTGRND